MVLCAGLGTRLRPLTLELPKPLLPVGDRSLVHHIADRLAAAGMTGLVLNTHYRPEAFARAELETLPLPAVLLHEPEILGTAGGVANAKAALGPGSVLVWNGDILADLDLGELLRAHGESGADATLAACPRPGNTGTIGLDDRGRIVRLRAERYGTEASSADFVGVQVISPALLRRLPARGCLVGDLYQPAIRAGAVVCALPLVSAWSDIGTAASYLEANLSWLRAAKLGSYVAPGASVAAEIELREAVLGAGASISGQGLVRRVVLWPGARAQAPLESAIVTTAGITLKL